MLAPARSPTIEQSSLSAYHGSMEFTSIGVGVVNEAMNLSKGNQMSAA